MKRADNMLDQKTISMIINDISSHTGNAKTYEFRISDLFVNSVQGWVNTVSGILMMLSIISAVIFAYYKNPLFKLIALVLEVISILAINISAIIFLYKSNKVLSSPTKTFLNTIEKSMEAELKLFYAFLKYPIEELRFFAERSKFEYDARTKVLGLVFGPLESVGFIPAVIAIVISAVELDAVTSVHNIIFYLSLAFCTANAVILMFSLYRELCLKKDYFLLRQAILFKESNLIEGKIDQALKV